MSALGRLIADRMLRQAVRNPGPVAVVVEPPEIRGAEPTSTVLWRVQWQNDHIDYATEARAESEAPVMAKAHGLVVVYPVVVQP